MSTPVIRLPWLPFNYDGLALGWVIIIRRGKEEFIVHEQEHIIQQKAFGFWTYMWRYWTNKRFRREMEFDAYVVMGWEKDKINKHLKEFYKV